MKSQSPKTRAFVGQTSSMTNEDYENVFRSIYQNQYFTNHGPLAKEFEGLLEDYLRINNVITVGNESLALLIALAGLDLKGDVLLPAFGGHLSAGILSWLGLNARFCDVDKTSHQLSVDTVRSSIRSNVEAVLVIEIWGNRCDQELINFLCEEGLKVIVVAFDSFASKCNDRYVNDDRRVVTVYSFGMGQILCTLQGGAISVADDDLAHKFRSIRSSYGVRKPVKVKATCNGRFSEFQAGVGIKNFSYLEDYVAHNNRIIETYNSILGDCAGIEPYDYNFSEVVNGQSCPILINESYPITRDQLQQKLRLLGFETNSMTQPPSGFPVSELLNSQVLQLPVNNKISTDLASQLAEKISLLDEDRGRDQRGPRTPAQIRT